MLLKPISAWKAKTGGGGGGSLAFVNMLSAGTGSAATTHDFSLTNGEKYAVLVLGRQGTATSITTSDTDTVTARGTGFSAAGSDNMSGRFFDFTASSTGTVTLTVTMSGTIIRWVAVWKLPAATWDFVTEATDTNTNNASSEAVLDVNTASGDVVLGGVALNDSSSSYTASAGFDQIDAEVTQTRDACAASAASAAGGTPESFRTTYGSSFQQGGGISAVYRDTA